MDISSTSDKLSSSQVPRKKRVAHFSQLLQTQFRRERLIKVNSSKYEGTTWLCDSASLKSTKNMFTQPSFSNVVPAHVRVMQYPSDNVEQQPLSCCGKKDGSETRLLALFFVNLPTDLRGRPPRAASERGLRDRS